MSSRPREQTELRVTEQMEAMLSCRDLEPSTDFFDAGGTSLQAALLVQALESEFRVTLPLDRFFENPTPEQVALLLREGLAGAPEQLVIQVRDGDGGIPLVGLHGISGEVYCYRPLRTATLSCSVVGIRSVGADGREDPLQSFDAMAARYADALSAYGHHPPFVLAGFCASSFIAFALASALRERHGSDAVTALLAFDTAFEKERLSQVDRELLLQGRHPSIEARAKTGLAGMRCTFRNDSWEVIAEEFKHRGRLVADATADTFRRRMQTIGASTVALTDYVPEPQDVRVIAAFGPSVPSGQRVGALAAWRLLSPNVESLETTMEHDDYFACPRVHRLIEAETSRAEQSNDSFAPISRAT